MHSPAPHFRKHSTILGRLQTFFRLLFARKNLPQPKVDSLYVIRRSGPRGRDQV